MEHSHSRHGRDGRTTELSQLLARSRVNVHEAIHIADDEPLHPGRRRVGLPLGPKTARQSNQHAGRKSGGRVQGNQHRNPSPRLVIMPDRRHRLHFRFRNFVPGPPRARPRERIDLHRVVVRRRRYLPRAVERRVRYREPRLVLAYHPRRPAIPLPADFPQVPHPHVAVQRRCRHEVRTQRVQGEAADLLVGQAVDVRGGGRGARVVPAEAAVQAGKVEGVGVRGGEFDAGEGLVVVRGGRGVDFDGPAGGEVELADAGVVGGGVEVCAVCGAEVEGADGAGVELEACDGWVGVGVGVGVGVFGLEVRGCGRGLRAVEDAEVAQFVACEDQRLVRCRVEA